MDEELLDPAFGQKLAVRDLLRKFPAVGDAQKLRSRLDSFMDSALGPMGLRFERDVRPWVGSQLAIVAWPRRRPSAVVVLIRSKDDGRARDALATMRTRVGGTWSHRAHAGVTVMSTVPTGNAPAAYALLHHTVLLADDPDAIDKVIDAANGSTPRLSDAPAFRRTAASLPRERLATVYLNVADLTRGLESELAAGGVGAVPAPSPFGELNAFGSKDMSISAKGDGVAADVRVSVDRPKLSAADRSALAAMSRRNAILDWVPAGSYGFVAMTNLKRSLERQLHQISA